MFILTLKTQLKVFIRDRKFKNLLKFQALLLLIVLFVFQVCSFDFRELDVSADSYVIDTLTKYTIFYDRTSGNYGTANDVAGNPVPAGSKITLNIPSAYTVDTTISLSASVNEGPYTFPNYTISNNVVSINDLFPSQTIVSNVTLKIQNLRNPSPAITTDAFDGRIGTDYAEPIFLKSVVVLQPAEFQSCSMTFNPKFVNRTSAMVFTIVAKTQIPSTGIIEVEFPSSTWSEGSATSTTNYLPISSFMGCSSITSNVKPTLQCRGITNQNKVLVSNMLSSKINSGQTFSFQINNFLSPPSAKPSDLIKITSLDASSNKINVCSEYVSNLIPNEILSTKITITNGGNPLTVNQQYTIRFMFETVDAFALTDYFQIEFPAGSSFSWNPNLLSGGITLVKTSASFLNNLLRCYMNTALSVKTYSAPFTMFISAGTYTAPPSTEPTLNFKISIMRNGYPMQVGYQFLTPVASSLAGSLASRQTDIVNKMGSFTLSITLNDPLAASGKIRIKFPPQVTIASSSTTCATVTGTNLKDSPFCTINLTLRTIELTNINSSSSIIPMQTFNITLNDLINPSSTAPTSTFQVRTFYKSNDESLVAVGTIAGFTCKQAIIDASNVETTTSSYKVLDQGVTYYVKLTIENGIQLGGWLSLFIPKPVTLNTAVLATSCKRGINTLITTTTPCSLLSQDGTGYLIKFSSPFSTTGISKGQFIMLQVSGIAINPPSTSPASTFKIYTYSSTSFLIAKIQSSLSIQMTAPTSLTSSSYTRDSSKNYDLTNYQFTIKQLSVMEVSSVVTVEFPDSIKPNASSLCGMTSPFINSNLVCGFITQTTIKITLPSSIPIGSDTALTLTISNVRNPASFRPPGDFNIKTFTSGQLYKYAQGKTSNKVSNNIPSSFDQVNGYYTPSYLDADLTLTLSFDPAFQAPGYLHVSIPTYFIVASTLSCSQVANFNGVCTNPSTHTVSVNGSFISNGLITFQIAGFKSPIRAPISPEYVILTSFTQDDYQLDFSNNQVAFSLACDLPCKTCDASSKSACNSCYSNNQITDKINFDSNSKSCYSTCPDGKYQNQNTFLCQNCDLNCLTCERSATFCTACKQTSSFKYLHIKSVSEQICVFQCEQLMYPDTSKTPPTCVNCVSPCKTCTNLNYCLSCLSTFYFWNNGCSKSCPFSITVSSDITGNCQVCNTNCATCQNLVYQCTSCNSSLILFNKKCIAQCLQPLVYRPDIKTCGPCDAQCKACSVVASNCTSCDPTSIYAYYFQNDCKKQCPDLYYQNANTCTICSSLDMNCDYCVNSTHCEKCINTSSYIFLNGRCLDSIPDGYANISGIAQPCIGDCATCLNIQSNCTSCISLNLFENSCNSTCPATTIPLNKKCTACGYPCKTCSSTTTNCTSCNSSVSPKLYLILNRCQYECPAFYYPDPSVSKCQQCQFPCQKCTDLTTCLSCKDNYFLYQGKSCMLACPLLFIGINKICESCTPPCRTCIDAVTKCLSCQANYFFLNATNRCVTDCGQGLYEQYLNRTCISCTPPCKTCTNTTSTCLSCLTGILFQQQCIRQCPSKKYNETNVCLDCPTECSECSSKVACTNCTSSYFLYNNFCISKCPETHSVVTNQLCTKCSSINCHKCYDNDVCFSCVSDFNLLNGACLGTCPSGYETNGTHCIEILTGTLESSSNSMFPVPLTIATSVVLIACMMSKLQNHKTFLAGAIYALVGIIETLALLYYIYLYYINFYAENPIGIYIAVGALGLLYILNVFSIMQSIILCYDKKHTQWKDSSAMNKFFNIVSTIFGVLLSHKFKNLMFSRLFAFVVFSAPLDQVKKFKIFNIFSFISLIHSGGAIFSVITIIKLVDNKTQFFHACLDVLIVTGINILIAFFNAMKSSDFFDETTPEGLLLNKIVFGDEESYNAKISVDGNDVQNEEGQGYYSKIQHTLGSNQPFKFKQSDDSRQDLHSAYESDSLTKIAQKQYESVSIQAYDILDNKQSDPRTQVDFSTLRIKDEVNDSRFTTVFLNEDKSIQNTIGHSNRVDYSVQKYRDVSLIDRSIQESNRTNANNEISIQITNGLNNQLRDVSIQDSQRRAGQDVSIQRSSHYADQSGQFSLLQSQKSVQNAATLQDKSVYQSFHNQSWAGQNTIDVKDFSIQNEEEQIEYNEFNETLGNDETTIKKTDNIFFIEEENEGDDLSPLKSNIQNQMTIDRQQLPQEKAEDFDFPPEQIKSYEDELEQKIQQKQKQLERVKKEIQFKQKQSALKQKLMKQEQERLEKQLQNVQRTNLQLVQAVNSQPKCLDSKQLVNKSTMMRMIQQNEEATSVDNNQLATSFINSQTESQRLQNDQKKQNFEVDMNKYIKQKSQYEIEQSQEDSTKTKAKPNIRKPLQQSHKVEYYQKNRQIQVKSTKQPSAPLKIQNKQPLAESNFQKQPEKNRAQKESKQNLESQNQCDAKNLLQLKQTQNYIYQIEDCSLKHEEIGLDNSASQSNLEMNKFQTKRTNLRESQIKQQVHQQQQIQIQPKLILDESSVDKQLKDEEESSKSKIQPQGQEGNEEEQYFDSSQDIPNRTTQQNELQKNTRSDAEELAQKKKHKRVLSKQELMQELDSSRVLDHEQIRRTFNDQRRRMQVSSSQKKMIPPENKQTYRVNISKLASYQTSDRQNHLSINQISYDKRKASGSLLANAARNLVNSHSNDKENQILRKNSSQKNPLVIQKKWEHENEHVQNIIGSIQRSTQGNDSIPQGQNKFQIPKQTNERQRVQFPFETDKQQTFFYRHALQIGGSNYNERNQSQSKKSANLEKKLLQKLSAKKLSNNQHYGEQVEVNFQKEMKQQKMQNSNSHRKVIEQAIEHPKLGSQPRNMNRPETITSKQRPSTHLSKPPLKPHLKQYQSQEIFGDEYGQQSEEEYSQPDSLNKKISKIHRNNLIMDKMMERPQNDDLYEYYNRASTKKGNKKRSNQKRSASRNLGSHSKDKVDNGKKLEKIYMQRFDSTRNKY